MYLCLYTERVEQCECKKDFSSGRGTLLRKGVTMEWKGGGPELELFRAWPSCMWGQSWFRVLAQLVELDKNLQLRLADTDMVSAETGSIAKNYHSPGGKQELWRIFRVLISWAPKNRENVIKDKCLVLLSSLGVELWVKCSKGRRGVPAAKRLPVSGAWFMCVCVSVLVTQLCPTLCDPMDSSPLGSSAHGIFQARIL